VIINHLFAKDVHWCCLCITSVIGALGLSVYASEPVGRFGVSVATAGNTNIPVLVSLNKMLTPTALRDAAEEQVRIIGNVSNANDSTLDVAVRVTTSQGATSLCRAAVVRSRFACNYPQDFPGAPPLTASVLFVDAAEEGALMADAPSGGQAEATVVVYDSRARQLPELPAILTDDLLDRQGRPDRQCRQWATVRTLVNLFLHSHAAQIVNAARTDFDLDNGGDLAWFKANLTFYDFQWRDRDWSQPLGRRATRTFWQASWSTWFNASNDQPLDGNPKNRAFTNYRPYAFANDFADLLIMNTMRRSIESDDEHLENMCHEAVQNLLAMQHRQPGNFALTNSSGRREIYTAGAFHYGLFITGDYLTEGNGWFYNPKFNDYQDGGVLNGRAVWGLGEALRQDPSGSMAPDLKEGLALALRFCLNDGRGGGYVKKTPRNNVYWRDPGEHAYLLLGMLAACEVAPELPITLASNAPPTRLCDLCTAGLNALVDLEQPCHQWSQYPNVDSMAVDALARGVQVLPNVPDAKRWQETAIKVADAWLATKVAPSECAGPAVQFGLRLSPQSMTYVWQPGGNPQFFYYITGHWIQALADLYAITGRPAYRDRAEVMLAYLCGANPWRVRLFNELGGVYNWTDCTNGDGIQNLLRMDIYPESMAFCQIGIMHLLQALVKPPVEHNRLRVAAH